MSSHGGSRSGAGRPTVPEPAKPRSIRFRDKPWNLMHNHASRAGMSLVAYVARMTMSVVTPLSVGVMRWDDMTDHRHWQGAGRTIELVVAENKSVARSRVLTLQAVEPCALTPEQAEELGTALLDFASMHKAAPTPELP